ncbi:MAG: hypothetical protein GY730_10960 [bacterium]|nr:hypothetical protein [Gammaproteobacteria bacterium]MCP4051209.1 hypothetical protein [bacterium]
MKKIFTMLLALSLLNLNYSCSDDETVLQTNSSNGIVNFKKTIVSSNSVGNSSRRADGSYVGNNDMIYKISNITTQNDEYNDIVRDLIYEVNTDLMEVKIINKNNNKGYLKCDLILNSQGLYDMVIVDRVYNENINNNRSARSFYDDDNTTEEGENHNTIDDGGNGGGYWEVPGWLCAVGCGASAFAMSLADGPAPVADAIAIGYAIQCGSEC